MPATPETSVSPPNLLWRNEGGKDEAWEYGPRACRRAAPACDGRRPDGAIAGDELGGSAGRRAATASRHAARLKASAYDAPMGVRRGYGATASGGHEIGKPSSQSGNRRAGPEVAGGEHRDEGVGNPFERGVGRREDERGLPDPQAADPRPGAVDANLVAGPSLEVGRASGPGRCGDLKERAVLPSRLPPEGDFSVGRQRRVVADVGELREPSPPKRTGEALQSLEGLQGRNGGEREFRHRGPRLQTSALSECSDMACIAFASESTSPAPMTEVVGVASRACGTGRLRGGSWRVSAAIVHTPDSEAIPPARDSRSARTRLGPGGMRSAGRGARPAHRWRGRRR